MLDPTLAMQLSKFSLMATLMLVVLALACYTSVLVLGRSVRPEPVMAHAGALTGGGVATDELEQPPVASPPKRALAQYGTYFSWLGLFFLTACLFFLTVGTGHGPFTNQYEFSVSFAWGILVAYAYFEHHYHVRTLGLLILPIAAAFLLYAMSMGATSNPLVPRAAEPSAADHPHRRRSRRLRCVHDLLRSGRALSGPA